MRLFSYNRNNRKGVFNFSRYLVETNERRQSATPCPVKAVPGEVQHVDAGMPPKHLARPKPPTQDIVNEYLNTHAAAGESCTYDVKALKKHIETKYKELGYYDLKCKDVKPRYTRWKSRVQGTCMSAAS